MIGLATRLLGGIITPLIDQLSASSARLLRKLALFVVAGLSLVVVLIALTIAFDLWIASLAGSIAGALAVAGVYLLVAIIVVFLALRPAKKSQAARGARTAKDGRARPDDPNLQSQIDDFAGPLLGILQRLGLRREQLAVLAGTSVAKQLGPVPLVALAIVAGFLVGRMWKSWRGLLSSDLLAGLLSADLLGTLFGSKPDREKQPDDLT